MNWTSPADIKRQVLRLWDRRAILASNMNGNPLFPCRLALRGPSSSDLSGEFASVREWIDGLRQGEAAGYRIVWREVNHRIVGRNAVPKEIWIDSPDDALRLIGKRREAETFAGIVNQTMQRRRELLPWLERHALRALELADEWPCLLDIVDWLIAHPRPGVYLRQIDIPGVHTKFIERHRGVLAELLDLALPSEAICQEASGAGSFCRRYGFRDKPLRVRFRMLDLDKAVFPTGTDQDITVTHATFAGLNPPVQRIFITENETNFLAFPSLAQSLVIFGAGYGFEMLAQADWLHDRDIHYWGDIDTHGFAILDQLRASFPHAQSFLMDRETLLNHRDHWGSEPQPERREMPRLTVAEHDLYNELRQDCLGHHVRLEQERISFSWVENALRLLRERG